MKIRKYLGPQRLFIWHSIHGIACVILAVTGIGMYFSELGGYLMPFELHHDLHELAGITTCIVYLLFFLPYHLEVNHHRIHYRWRLMLHHLHVYADQHHLSKKQFKPIYAARYVFVMFMIFPILMTTGSLMIFPEFISIHVGGFDLYRIILLLHIFAAVLTILFTVIHLFVAFVNKKSAVMLHVFFKYWFKS